MTPEQEARSALLSLALTTEEMQVIGYLTRAPRYTWEIHQAMSDNGVRHAMSFIWETLHKAVGIGAVGMAYKPGDGYDSWWLT